MADPQLLPAMSDVAELSDAPDSSPPLQRYAVKRRLFKTPAAQPEMLDMSLLKVLTEGVVDLKGYGDGPGSVLRDFAHTNHLYQPSLSLVLQRVLVVGVRTFFMLLSDGFTSVWALAVDDRQMMDLVYEYRTSLRGSRLQVVLQKCMMRKSACYFLATNIRMEGMDSDEDTTNYVTEKGVVLPGSAFGKEAQTQQDNTKQWRMLICNGPRVSGASHASGETEHLISFVNECIAENVHKETFSVRLSVLRVDEMELLLTDGTRTLMARFADELAFVNGVFSKGTTLSKKCDVGDVLDIQAMGYAHMDHKRQQGTFQHYPTCIVTKCLQHLGRDKPGKHVRSLMHSAFLDHQETEALKPAVYTLPPHAVTRKGRHKCLMTVAAHSALACSSALVKNAKHAADLAHALNTKLSGFFEREDYMLVLTNLLIPREVSMLMRSSKIMMCRVLRQYVAAKFHTFMPAYLVVPRLQLKYGNQRIRRDNIYFQLYRKLVDSQFAVSLGAATGGVILYEARSKARMFSMERVLGSFKIDNMLECRCLVKGFEGVSEQRRLWRSVAPKNIMRCTLCAFKRERERLYWSIGLEGADEVAEKIAEMDSYCTHSRVVLGLRHRFMFRDERARWTQVDNMRRMLLTFHSRILQDSEFFSSYGLSYLQEMQGPREHRLSDVKQMRLADGSMQSLNLHGCIATLKKLNRVFPLTPGSLKVLQEECTLKCKEIWDFWLTTPMCEMDTRETMHVATFMPDLADGLPRLRLVLQITSTLMHGVRVIYVQPQGHARQCVLHIDPNFVSFLAHDGRNELLFSTDCTSFMRLLDQALVAQEVDAEYQKITGLNRSVDDLRMWTGKSDPNVLADYVVACSVHEVQDVAHVCFSDVLDIDETYSSVVHELRVFDFEILDTKMPYTSLDEEDLPELRQNRLCCHQLVYDMSHENTNLLLDIHLRRVQQIRRNGDMESDDESENDSQDDHVMDPGDDEEAPMTPTTPTYTSIHQNASNATVVYQQDEMELASGQDDEMQHAYLYSEEGSARDSDEPLSSGNMPQQDTVEEEDLPSSQEQQ